MIIHKDKKPIDIIYSYVKDLASEIEIYKYAMDEDYDSTPDSYLLLRPDVTNNTNTFGDGESKIRQASCDLILISKGYEKSDSKHRQNIKKIQDLLDSKGIAYSGYDLGYDNSLKSCQYTFSLVVYYYG